jgi:hypothetical protein
MKLRATLALGLAAAWLALVSPSAGASTVLDYPAIPCSTLSVSTTNPLPGARITVTGTLFAPHANVRLELSGTGDTLGTVTTNSAGSFKTTVTLPADAQGRQQIVAVGGDVAGSVGCPADPSQSLDIQGASTSTGASGGGTAFTGVDILALLAAAAVLVGGGVLLQRSGKRRRAFASRH